MEVKKLFNDIEKHLLEDEKPSLYLNKIKNQGLLDKEPFNFLKNLEKVEQSPIHHPEGNVWVHTLMVVDQGAMYREKANDVRSFMWALLLHDIGKPKATKFKNGRWTAYDHDKIGELESIKFLSFLTKNQEFIHKVSKLIRYHMHLIFVIKNLPFLDEEGLKKYTDINDISLVFLSDRFGRSGISKEENLTIRKEVEKFIEMYS